MIKTSGSGRAILKHFGLVIVALGLVAIACGGDSEADPAATSAGGPAPPTPTTTPAGAGPPAPASFSLADTPIVASLTITYKVGPAGSMVPTAAELPAPSGSIEARWYQADGRYVVYYSGLDLSASGPLCPGNSIRTTTGFQHITNAPTASGACAGAQNLAGSGEGVRLCGDQVLYATRIPVDLEGDLFGTVERFLPDGTIIGLTSMVRTDRARTPSVDLSPCRPASN